jgi:transcription antitermination factor NusG
MAVACFSGVGMDACHQRWPWFALLTRLGRERHAGTSLANMGYEYYLPMSCSIRRWSDRWKKVETPLFPGYLFCRMNPHDRLPVLTTPGIVKIVSVGKTPAPVEEGEISALQRVESSGLPTIPWPYIEVGDVARIGDGPLKGLTGAVTRIKSEMKLILSVSLLQRSVAVEIDRDWIVDVETPPSATNEPASLASIARLIQPCGP